MKISREVLNIVLKSLNINSRQLIETQLKINNITITEPDYLAKARELAESANYRVACIDYEKHIKALQAEIDRLKQNK